jgi:hypothetical protein
VSDHWPESEDSAPRIECDTCQEAMPSATESGNCDRCDSEWQSKQGDGSSAVERPAANEPQGLVRQTAGSNPAHRTPIGMVAVLADIMRRFEVVR